MNLTQGLSDGLALVATACCALLALASGASYTFLATQAGTLGQLARRAVGAKLRQFAQSLHRVVPQPADDVVIARALRILEGRMRYPEIVFNAPTAAEQYARLRIGDRDREVFLVLYLNANHALIEARKMFYGTLTEMRVYPREIVKTALELRSAALIVSHNHPTSGSVQPSRADEAITQTLRSALSLVDVRVLDHIVVNQVATFSMAAHGLL